MALPKPLSDGGQSGLPPQVRRKSGLRTASDSLQEDVLARWRAVVEDPTLLLPESVGPEVPAIAQTRRKLEAARHGRFPLLARFDKGLLGALRETARMAARDEVPRLLDIRVDGQRRFFLPSGHVNRLVIAGVQNHDDPMARLLAWGTLAAKHDLHLWAGSMLWSTKDCTPPMEWVHDLSERSGIVLESRENDWHCPHGDRVRVAHRFEAGTRVLACVPCASRDGRLWDHLLTRHLCGPHPSHPVTLHVRPAGSHDDVEVPATLTDAYRVGRIDLQRVVEETLHHKGSNAKWEIAGRAFDDAAALAATLGLEGPEHAAALVLLADGHRGSSAAMSDILNAHRDRLSAALHAIVPGEGDALAQRFGSSDVREALRRATEDAERRRLAAQRPKQAGLGTLGAWIDGFVRDLDVMDRRDVLQRVRKEIPSNKQPAHLCAFLEAAGFAGEGERSFTPDQKEAGRAWAPLAKAVIAARGPGYAEALRAYLEQTGAGETVA